MLKYLCAQVYQNSYLHSFVQLKQMGAVAPARKINMDSDNGIHWFSTIYNNFSYLEIIKNFSFPFFDSSDCRTGGVP